MSVPIDSSDKQIKDISLSVINNHDFPIIKMFPDGCGGCPGLCCITICGRPPDVMPRTGPPQLCRELTPEGLCSIHLDKGYDSKPDICKKLQVGGDECLAARKEAGL